MARVFAVKDPVTGHQRAVKLLTQRGMAWTRFGREYRALARLDHPNIVKVFRYGVDELLQAYLVMEWVQGLPIQEWVARFGEPGEARRTSAAVCALTGLAEALAYLHRRRYIHRDLKSNNVLVRDDGTAKLLDFGATRGIGPDASSITRMGEFVGTFTYASPEQIDGDTLDERSDIYSLGVLAYRLLCGRPPFEADSVVALSRMHFEVEPAPPHRYVPGLPESLSRLILTMLAKRPEDRVQSAGEVADALREHARTEAGGLSSPPRGALHAPRLVGRHGVLLSIEAMIARARPGRMALLVGAPGSGRDRMLSEAAALTKAAGLACWKLDFDASGALRVQAGPDEQPVGPEPLLDALQGRAEPAALLVRHLEHASRTSLEGLRQLRAGVVERGLQVLFFASLLDHADTSAVRLAFLDAARLPLRALTSGEVEALASSMLGEDTAAPRTLRAITLATGGQPGFVARVTEAMATEGLFELVQSPVGVTRWLDRSEGRVTVPAPIRRVLIRRLGQQSRSSLRLLMAIALAREAAHPAVLSRALAIPAQELEAMGAKLQHDGVLAAGSQLQLLSFRVRLMERILLDKVVDRDREHLERRLAAALPAPDPCMDAVRLLAAAGRDEQAQDELVRCLHASRTGHGLASQVAVVSRVVERATRQGLAEPKTLARLELCWTRAISATDLDDPRMDEALDRARDLVTSPEIGAEVMLERARVHGLRGEGEEQGAALDQAEVQLGSTGSVDCRCRVQHARSSHALCLGDLALAEAHAVQALALATRSRDPHAEGMARVAHASALGARGQLTQAEGQLVAARARLARDAAGRDVWIAELERSRLMRIQGRLSEALELLEPQLEEARLVNAPSRILATITALTHVELDLYRLGDARVRLAELSDMGVAATHPISAAELAFARGRLALASGEPEAAVDGLALAMTAADAAGLAVAARRLQAYLGEALALAGDPGRGANACDQAVEGLAAMGHMPAACAACACRVRSLTTTIDPTGCFRPVLPWLMENPIRLARMDYLLASAEHAAARGDTRNASYAYQEATLLLEELSGLLSPDLRAAFQVHPWYRRAARGEGAGQAWRGRR